MGIKCIECGTDIYCDTYRSDGSGPYCIDCAFPEESCVDDLDSSSINADFGRMVKSLPGDHALVNTGARWIIKFWDIDKWRVLARADTPEEVVSYWFNTLRGTYDHD